MKTTEHGIVDSRYVENFYHMRLMALLQELVRKKGYKGAAEALGIDPKTVTSSMRSGQLTIRVREALERALQEGVGSAAERQRRRNEKLEGQLKELKEELRGGLKGLSRVEGRLDKLEGQVKELRETLPSDLKRLKMSLDGVRKYYGVQRGLIKQRLLALEAGGGGTETGASAGDESGEGSRPSGVAASALHPRQFKGATQAEVLDAEERSSMRMAHDTYAVPSDGDERAQVSAEPDRPRRAQRSKRKLAQRKKGEHESAGGGFLRV